MTINMTFGLIFVVCSYAILTIRDSWVGFAIFITCALFMFLIDIVYLLGRIADKIETTETPGKPNTNPSTTSVNNFTNYDDKRAYIPELDWKM